MNLITEEIIKTMIKKGENVSNGELKVPTNTVLTPAAKSILSDSKLKLVIADNIIKNKCQSELSNENDTDVIKTAEKLSAKSIGKFQLENGGFLDEKPECMTQIFGNLLVFKDHKIIKLRGEIDLLMSEIMKVQIVAEKHNLKGLVSDLQDICKYVGEMSRCEILNDDMKESTILGLNYDEIREMSHHPKKYFGKEHLFNITYQLGEIPILLNYLRALVRKVEISCYEAFKLPGGKVERIELIQGYNRLSSVIYIITFKYLTNHYGR